jgi:CBS domain-containing protein
MMAEFEDDSGMAEPESVGERDVVVTVRQGILAAGRLPTIIKASDTVQKALTMLTDLNVEQLVVAQGNRGIVEGIFSWRSYCRASLSGKSPKFVNDCLSTDFAEINEKKPLFDAVRDVIRHGVVVVRANDKQLCGLVTARDAAEVFVELAEPFLFLGQIENHLRELVDRMRLSPELLRASRRAR